MAGTRTSSIPELLLTLDRERPVALHRQLERGLQDAIRSGRLQPGAPLPSTRALADALQLSRGVVVEAYEQLTAEGYLDSRPGGKTRVAERAPEVARPERRSNGRQVGRSLGRPPGRSNGESRGWPIAPASEPEPPGEDEVVPPFAHTRLRWDFSYGRPDVTSFPRQAWLQSLRRVLNSTPSETLSYLDGRGSVELRLALASYLNRVRATSATAGRMIVTNGFAQAQRLTFQVVKELGGRRIAMEDPGQTDTRRAADLFGLEIVPVPVDEDGLRIDRLAAVDADLVVVTPAHQFPTGAVLSPERRAALVRWARERDAYVLEDDYDAEYRYDREPIGAIQGLAPDRVIYAGSASKTLAPGLRLGWLVLPVRLVEPFATAKFAGDRGSPSLDQLAFADFLSRGEFDRHLRRMRPIYRARRDALLAALARFVPEVRPVGASAGLHVLAWLPAGWDEAAIVARAAEAEIAVDAVGGYRGG